MEERYFVCPSGHRLPAKEFHSYVSTKEADLDVGITFTCPGGKREHTFTLRKAVSKGMFTVDEAVRIKDEAARIKGQAVEQIEVKDGE